MKWNHHSYPGGPRSCPSYVVSSRHHLIDPIRPTRGHIAISPRSGLYAMSSLCGSAEATREWFRAFAAHSFLTCRPLRPRGVRTSYRPNSRCRHGLRHILTGSTLPNHPQSVGYDYDIDWTPLSAGLAPAGMAASFAALGWVEPFAKPIVIIGHY